MGLLKDLVGIAAPIAGTIIGGPLGGSIGGALGGLVSGSGQPKSTTATQQQKLDPRIEQMLFGSNGQQGLLGQYQGMLNTPRSAASTAFAGANADYLSNFGGADLGAVRNAALQSMGGNAAPMATAATATAAQAPTALAGAASASLPSYAVGNMVDAPAQNNMNLSGAYDRFINGTPGANQYLDQSINGAIAQNRLGFQQLQDDSTKNLMQSILPSIRSNSVLAGQYGGSRQGIAEGNAIGTQQTELARAASQFGQNATNAAVNAKAQAYETDSNRALAATQGLGAQQYGVAQQNAATKNQAEFMNVGNQFDASKINAGMQQQTNLANLGSQQAMNLAGLNAQQQTNMTNAGFQQQAGLANQQSQLTTNAQNNGALLGGAGLLSGLLGQAQGTVDQNDNWALNRAHGVNSLLAPYLGANSSSTNTQPLYNNPVGNAVAGLGMGAQLGGLFGGSTGQMGEKMGGLSDLFSGKFLNF